MMPEVDTERLADEELVGLMAELDEADGWLPEGAIVRLRELRDLAVPWLIEALRNATALAREGRTPTGNAHFFALFLLAEFRAKEGLPAILEAMSLPGELPFDLFGDAVLETLARVLTDLADDPRASADALIRDRALNEFVRWEAAQAYVYLVRDGRLTREQAVEGLRQHLREALDTGDEQIVSPLVLVLTSLAPVEAMLEISEAFERDLIGEFDTNISEVEEAIREGESRVLETLERCPPTGVADTIAELRHWTTFREPEEQEETDKWPFTPGLVYDETDFEPKEPLLQPIVRDAPRIGRNAPCPLRQRQEIQEMLWRAAAKRAVTTVGGRRLCLVAADSGAYDRK